MLLSYFICIIHVLYIYLGSDNIIHCAFLRNSVNWHSCVSIYIYIYIFILSGFGNILQIGFRVNMSTTENSDGAVRQRSLSRGVDGDVLLDPLQFPRLTGLIAPAAPRPGRRVLPAATSFKPISGVCTSSGNGGKLLVIPNQNISHVLINTVEALVGGDTEEDTGVGSQLKTLCRGLRYLKWWQWINRLL